MRYPPTCDVEKKKKKNKQKERKKKSPAGCALMISTFRRSAPNVSVRETYQGGAIATMLRRRIYSLSSRASGNVLKTSHSIWRKVTKKSVAPLRALGHPRHCRIACRSSELLIAFAGLTCSNTFHRIYLWILWSGLNSLT